MKRSDLFGLSFAFLGFGVSQLGLWAVLGGRSRVIVAVVALVLFVVLQGWRERLIQRDARREDR